MEAIAASLGLSIAMLALAAVIVGLLFPVFWLWMLVDSIVRDKAEYPSGDDTEKLMWVLLMVFIQPVAVLYFFMVWRAGRVKAAPAVTAPAA